MRRPAKRPGLPWHSPSMYPTHARQSQQVSSSAGPAGLRNTASAIQHRLHYGQVIVPSGPAQRRRYDPYLAPNGNSLEFALVPAERGVARSTGSSGQPLNSRVEVPLLRQEDGERAAVDDSIYSPGTSPANAGVPHTSALSLSRLSPSSPPFPGSHLNAPTTAALQAASANAAEPDAEWADFCRVWLLTQRRCAEFVLSLEYDNGGAPGPFDGMLMQDPRSHGDAAGGREPHRLSISGLFTGDPSFATARVVRNSATAFVATGLDLRVSPGHAAPPQPSHSSSSQLVVHATPPHLRPTKLPRPISCPNCGRTPTTADLGEWRTGTVTRGMICSACGQYEKRKGVPRPPELENKRRNGNGNRVYGPKK
ncbi:GATA-type domain-containing protein [Mycena chlorophos]|uniref:GATA-type domain-containing protein n=1 Tax=Mycena chlorophos TaxID=658473 RepID=A0A8H6TPD0_MYCCL|nr:GATA-type domain-containing protein [Mycena chlorophos]